MKDCMMMNSFLVFHNSDKGNIIVEMDRRSALQLSERSLRTESIPETIPQQAFVHPPPISTTAHLSWVQRRQKGTEDRIQQMLTETRLALEY